MRCICLHIPMRFGLFRIGLLLSPGSVCQHLHSAGEHVLDDVRLLLQPKAVLAAVGGQVHVLLSTKVTAGTHIVLVSGQLPVRICWGGCCSNGRA
jgi:hypothetical protein